MQRRLHGFERQALALAQAFLPKQALDFEPGQVPGSLQSARMTMLCLRLSLLPGTEQQQTLRCLLSTAPLLLVVDWHSAERNLECPASAFTGGLLKARAKFGYGNAGVEAFRAYRRTGGLAGLLHREHQQFDLCHYQPYWGGGLALAVLRPAPI